MRFFGGSLTRGPRGLPTVTAGLAAVAGGQQYLVHGSYDYYHYLQDGINDAVVFFAPGQRRAADAGLMQATLSAASFLARVR